MKYLDIAREGLDIPVKDIDVAREHFYIPMKHLDVARKGLDIPVKDIDVARHVLFQNAHPRTGIRKVGLQHRNTRGVTR